MVDLKSARVLVVDDDAGVRAALVRLLKRGGIEARTESSGLAGLAVLEEFKPDLVISDHRMPGMDGVEFLTQVKQRLPHTQRILLTGEAEREAIEGAIARSEVFRLIFKPWDDAQMKMTVRSALEQRELALEVERLHRLTQDRNADLEVRVQQRTEALSEAKREWELTFDTIDTPIVLVGLEDLIIRRANRAAVPMSQSGLRSVVNNGATCHQTLFDRPTPCTNCPVSPQLKAPVTAELQHGERTWVMRAHPMENAPVAVCHYREVTEERMMARRFAESDKLSAIGSLAGGVAHEINNPLSGILGFSQILRRTPGRNADDLEALEVIEESAKRCKAIVSSLLKFSRRNRLEDRRQFDVSSCLEETLTLFRAEARRHPRLKLTATLAPNLPPIFGDSAQLAQVALNLLQNALQALPGGEGEIEVITGKKDTGCFFSVRDTGTGIPAEVLPRIFDPLFTTKPPGEGTGLGLAIAAGIIADHGGLLSVDTEPGKGSTFTAVIPTATQKEQTN